MKNAKIKVLVVALAICMIAVGSLGTLAWFNASDSVTNNFHIANSEDEPDKIFSVDVWEDATPDDPAGEEKDQDGIDFTDILPGETFYKEAHIENTGSYPQYIRATITVSDASVWQKVYGQYMVKLTDFVTLNPNLNIYKEVSYYDAVEDTFVYQLYLTDILDVAKDVVVFDTVKLSEKLNRFQAAELEGSFYVKVVADAVQTEFVGNNVYEAFETVGLVKATPISDAADLAAALADEKEARIIVDAGALINNTLTIDSAIKNKVIDFNGQDAAVVFSATATTENVVISGIVDTDGNGFSVETAADFTGDLTIAGCSFKDTADKPLGSVRPAGGNVTIDNCSFVSDNSGKTYGVRTDHRTGNLAITNCSFTGFKSWPIIVNGTNTGDLTVDNCTFTDLGGGVFKTLGGGVTGNFTFTNNTMTNCPGDNNDVNKLVVSGSSNGPVIVSGTKTISGNTLDGEAWTQA